MSRTVSVIQVFSFSEFCTFGVACVTTGFLRRAQLGSRWVPRPQVAAVSPDSSALTFLVSCHPVLVCSSSATPAKPMEDPPVVSFRSQTLLSCFLCLISLGHVPQFFIPSVFHATPPLQLCLFCR